MLYTPYCDLDLILLLDKVTGCFDWSFDTSEVPVSIWRKIHMVLGPVKLSALDAFV